MLGPGRPAKDPAILGIRQLTKEEIVNTPRDNSISTVTRMRESHHRIARYVAMGHRITEVAEITGYSTSTIHNLRNSPAFQELVALYSKDVEESFKEGRDEYYDTVISNRIAAARRLNDKLLDEDEEFTVAQLVAIHADTADRTGYPKRSVAVNVNVDFAARLDRAIARSGKAKVIDALPPASPPQITGGGEGETPRTPVAPPLLQRRA